MHSLSITMTIGRRTQLLNETLSSLKPLLDIYPARAVNDFGDDETNDVFRTHCPNGCLLVNKSRLGHHASIDQLYTGLETEYVFHLEDDWLFQSTDFLDNAIGLLNANHKISSVGLRSLSDMHIEDYNIQSTQILNGKSVPFVRLDQKRTWWHGYTFNPHIIKNENIKKIGNFSNYKKERNISRMFKRKGLFVAYMQPGFCSHIGFGESVSGNDLKDKSATYKQYKKIKNGIKTRLRFWQI